MTVSPLSLRHNFSWIFLGNIIYAFCLWGMLTILTKLGSTVTVGRFALASAIATPVIMFASLQLRSVLAADSEDAHEFQDYLAVRLLLLPVAMLVVLGIALGGYTSAQATAIMLFGLARCIEAVSDIFYGVAQKNDRMDLVAISKVIKGIAALCLFGVTFHLTDSLNKALLAMAIAWAVPLFLYDIPRVRSLSRSLGGPSLSPRLRLAEMRSIVWTTLPLGFVILLAQMRHTIPRTFLESTFGEDMVGIYAAISYLVIAGSTIVMALGQASLARLSQYYASGQMKRFKRLGKQLGLLGLGIGLAGVMVAVLGGSFLLRHLYSEEYAAHADLLVLIMAGGGFFFLATLLAPLTTAMKAFRGQLLVQTINVVILLLLASLLIPRFGMTGAAWAFLGAAAWTVLGFLLLIRAGIRKQQGWKNHWVEALFR